MKQKSKKLIILFIISLVMILGFATIVNAADDEFKLTVTTADVVLNGTTTLFCYNKPTGETVNWSSSNSSIASVDSEGKITGKAIGTATITATAGSKTATCTINVVYRSLLDRSTTKVSLIIGEHDSQTVSITAEDYNNKKITNPKAEWKSENEDIAKVDSNGKITAVKAGSTKVTVKVPGAETDFDVVVTNLPKFTDFSNAKIELVKESTSRVQLNVNNISISEKNSSYYYTITSKNEKPELKLAKSGEVDTDSSDSKWKKMYKNRTALVEGYNLEDYVELNQDLYLWIAESVNLDEGYYDESENLVTVKTNYVVSGQKLERPKYPTYAEMFFATMITYRDTQLVFNIPTGENTKRKFTVKIGKITDKTILNGIKNNNGEAWNSLQEYSNKSNAIFNKKLESNGKYGSEYISRNGVEAIDLKLEDDAYYYMSVIFDDENGKYYPASGLTIAKADIFTTGEWYLFFLGDDKFKWEDFGTIQTGTATVDGNQVGTTKAGPTTLPYTGITTIGLVIVAMVGTAVFFKVKNNKYKGI